MSPRNWKFRLEDIRDALSLIEEYVKGFDYSAWTEDRKTVDAVIRNLQIIGEAANHIPLSVQDRYAAIPWLEMKGMRNILVHEYFGVDPNSIFCGSRFICVPPINDTWASECSKWMSGRRTTADP